MTRTLTFSIATAALLLSGAAYAQVTAPTASPAREARPEMTRAAVQERSVQMFTRLDANADGKIDAADRALRSETTAENAGERTAARFARFDTNSDGAISAEEFAALSEMRQNRRGERSGRRGGGGMGQARALLGQADTDSNSAVTQAEFTAAMIARFDAADTNNDGTVSREERRAARPEARGGEGRHDRMHRQRETNG